MYKNTDFLKSTYDFIFLNQSNPEEKAETIMRIKASLEPRGFEKYIEYYLNKIHSFKVKCNSINTGFDGGIDIEGVSNNGKRVIIQCKKYTITDVTLDEVAAFYGKIVNKDIILNPQNYVLMYVTTSKFTQRALEYAKTKGILVKNCLDIYNLREKYSLTDFKKDLLLNDGTKEYSHCFVKMQPSLPDIDIVKIKKEISEKDAYTLLKQARKDLADSKQLQLHEVCKNDTLKKLAKVRPHNFQAVKSCCISDKNELGKLEKYGSYFLQRLRYI